MEKQFLVPFIRTDFERDTFLEQGESLLDTLTGVRQVKSVKDQFAQSFDGELVQALLTDLQASGLEAASWLKQVMASVESWPTLYLTVAVRPAERLIARIAMWLVDAMGRPVVVGYRYEPSVLGGAIVEWEGKYVDLSLRKKLNTYIAHYDFRQFLEIKS